VGRRERAAAGHGDHCEGSGDDAVPTTPAYAVPDQRQRRAARHQREPVVGERGTKALL
jgi:hypothetical protein